MSYDLHAEHSRVISRLRTVDQGFMRLSRHTRTSKLMDPELLVLLDFSLTVKAAPHECVIRTSQP